MNVRPLLVSLVATGLLTALALELVGVAIGADLPALAGFVFGVSAAGVTQLALLPFRSPSPSPSRQQS